MSERLVDTDGWLGRKGLAPDMQMRPSAPCDTRVSTPSASRSRFGAAAYVVATAICLSACVIPIAPEFEDPEENQPPYIFSSDPPVGSEILAGGATEIVVTLADPNVSDFLHVRWIFDYPKYDENLTRVVLGPILPPAGNRGPVRDSIKILPSCLIHNIAKGVSRHRLTLSVSDRGFVSERDAPREFQADTVPTGGFLVRATWYLNLECE